MGRVKAVLAFLLVGMYCQNMTALLLPYEPDIIFTGFFNNTYDSLAGNRQWPNRCELVGDTVRIYCYSTFFSESNRIRHGDLVRFDLYPDSGDGFEKRNTLFHMARYYDCSESYTINRGDTLNPEIRLKCNIQSFSRRVGGEIDLNPISVFTPALKNGRYLEIKDGRLFGRIRQ